MYYQDNKVTIYNKCCLDAMKQFADSYFDLVFTSPPYNMRTRIRNGEYTEREQSAHFSKKYSEFSDALPVDKYYQFHKQVILEMLRVSKTVFINIQIVTGSKEAWFKLIGDFNTYIKDIIIWDKGAGQPAMHEAILNRGYEILLVLENKQVAGREFKHSTFKRGTMPDIWRLGRGGQGKISGHGATFPLELPLMAIRNWKSDKILDPFMGSGTTLIAAIQENKKVYGIELYEKYCQIAVSRIKNIQPRLL